MDDKKRCREEQAEFVSLEIANFIQKLEGENIDLEVYISVLGISFIHLCLILFSEKDARNYIYDMYKTCLRNKIEKHLEDELKQNQN